MVEGGSREASPKGEKLGFPSGVSDPPVPLPVARDSATPSARARPLRAPGHVSGAADAAGTRSANLSSS